MSEPDIVVVGAGPAGLAAATVLRRGGAGHVVLLERDTEAGGIPRHCGHSPFGMREFRRVLSGRNYARRLVADALAAGVDLRLRHAAIAIDDGPAITVAAPDGSVVMHPRRVLLATGVRETSRAGRLVSGDRPLGVLNTGALQDFVYLRNLTPFRRPVIVGTELVAMSAILTCRSAGIRPVAVIEERPRPVVRAPFHFLPRLLGIPVHLGTRLVDIAGRPCVASVTIQTGAETRDIQCDGVLFTGKFIPEASLARLSGITLDEHTGGPRIDAAGRTSRPDIFAAGNILRGVETAGWSWAEGGDIAEAMLRDLANPQSAATIPVVAGTGISLVVPQCIARDGAHGLAALQVRIDRPASGRLTVRSGARTLYTRRLRSGPERRILIPLGALPIADDTVALDVAFEEQAG